MAKETLRKSIGVSVKRLSLGLTLIALAGAVLLFSDLNQRRPRDKNLRKIAILPSSIKTS